MREIFSSAVPLQAQCILRVLNVVRTNLKMIELNILIYDYGVIISMNGWQTVASLTPKSLSLMDSIHQTRL